MKWNGINSVAKIIFFWLRQAVSFKELLGDINPYDVFTLFVNDEIINLLVLAQLKLNKSILILYLRIHKWTPTNPEEIKKFLGWDF